MKPGQRLFNALPKMFPMILRGTVINLRRGIVLALLGILAVFLFRPETTSDEAAVFVLVPMAVFFAMVRILAAVVERVDVPRGVAPDARRKRFAWLLLFALAAVCVGLPSMFIYRALGVMWAVDLAARVEVLLLAVSVVGGFFAGMRFVLIYQFAVRALKAIISTPKDIAALNH